MSRLELSLTSDVLGSKWLIRVYVDAESRVYIGSINPSNNINNTIHLKLPKLRQLANHLNLLVNTLEADRGVLLRLASILEGNDAETAKE